MKLIPNLSKIVLVVLTANILMLCGCSKNKQNQESQAKQMKASEQSDKVPKDLENIESSIEKIIKTLGGPSVTLKEEKKQEEGQNQAPQKTGQNQGQQSSQSSGDQNQGQQGSEGGQGSQGSQGQKTPQPSNNAQNSQNQASATKDPWQEISPVINNLHYQWNSYLPSATKKNANRQLLDNFDNALNTLTSTILTKNKDNTLLAANNLYSYVPDFYMLYKTETSPEIKRIRYFARNAVLNATISNWDQAGKDISNLKSTWGIYKNTVDPKNQDISSKLDYSIYELEKVVTEKNLSLTDIKGRIAISNTESLEKEAKKS
ncbi:hypothetical protein [Acetivibrio cellulolyticus]